MLAQKYRQLSTQARRLDRAKVHFIPRGVFPSLLDEEWEDLPDWSDQTHHDQILAYLQGQAELKRGDIIVVEEQLTGDDMGKFAFDGERLIRWNFEPESGKVRFLPDEFQVIIEFPLQYWIETVDYSREYLVPFNYNKQLPDIKETQVYQIGKLKVLPFQSPQNQVFYIVGSENNSFGSFMKYVPRLKYFDVSYTYELPPGLNNENTLYVPDVVTPGLYD